MDNDELMYRFVMPILLQIPVMQGSQTLGKTKKSKNSQRHSAGNIDYENMHDSQEADDLPPHVHMGFRSRSKTVGDAAGNTVFLPLLLLNAM